MDVGGWLRSLGLEQYEPAFRENRIDRESLPKLTAENLKDLRVSWPATAAGCSRPSVASSPSCSAIRPLDVAFGAARPRRQARFHLIEAKALLDVLRLK